MAEQKNYGFKTPQFAEDHYVLGGLGIVSKQILCPERNWLRYAPIGEPQQRLIETSSCTEFGTLNIIEMLQRRLYGIEPDYSERFVAIGSGNSPDGNDPHIVAEWIRKNGLVNEKDLPFDDSLRTWSDYFSPNPLTNQLLGKGQRWLKQYNFQHEWVFTGGTIEQKQQKLLEALQYSPIGVSVRAWTRNGTSRYVKPAGAQDNHWCVLAGAVNGSHWLIYDSYTDDDFVKELDWQYDFGFAKLFSITETTKQCFLTKLFG